MDMKSLDRANEIRKRLDKLKIMRKWLEDKEWSAYLIGSGVGLDGAVALSPDMRTVLLGMCIGETARLQKEFDNL